MTETLIVQKVAYILASFSEGDWFSYLFSVLRKISYKLGNQILDDGNFVGPKSSLHQCFSSRKRTVSVSFISFEKYELRMRKIFRKIFCPLFCSKTPSMKKNLRSFFVQNVAHKTLVQFTRPWTLYSVAVLRSK